MPALTRPGLDALHDWLATNGEAIYATRPWRTYGESLDTACREQSDNGTAFHDAVYDGTPRDVVPDFRYTRRADTVYVIVRHVAAPSFLLRAFRPTGAGHFLADAAAFEEVALEAVHGAAELQLRPARGGRRRGRLDDVLLARTRRLYHLVHRAVARSGNWWAK